MSKHVDIIGTFPDDFLCRIISLLPIMDAIHTYILSSGWKNIIDYVADLDITYHVPTLAFINTLHMLLPSTRSSTNLQTVQKI